MIDEKTGARLALKRIAPTAEEPNGLWQTAGEDGNQSYSTADLLGILDAEPERISPAALLRPVFQDFLFGTTAQVGGPAEIAYLAQSTVLFERILGRQTPPIARFSATLIEPAIAELLRQARTHAGTGIWRGERGRAGASGWRRGPCRLRPRESWLRRATRSMPNSTMLVDWLQSQDKGLGQSAETAAGKMRYQMNRLRTLAANFQLQREATLTRHANSDLRMRSIPAACCRSGCMGRRITLRATDWIWRRRCASRPAACPGHTAIWL